MQLSSREDQISTNDTRMGLVVCAQIKLVGVTVGVLPFVEVLHVIHKTRIIRGVASWGAAISVYEEFITTRSHTFAPIPPENGEEQTQLLWDLASSRPVQGLTVQAAELPHISVGAHNPRVHKMATVGHDKSQFDLDFRRHGFFKMDF
jgi:hypothetical protein